MMTGLDSHDVPAFLLKLVDLLDSPNLQDYISWSKDGKSFIIYNPTSFSKHVLPMYFKHNKLASFIRQLNLYGFRKAVTVDSADHLFHESVVFQHPLFVKENPEFLPLIKRKIPQAKPQNSSPIDKKLSNAVDKLRTEQDKTTTSISALRQENDDLWREVVLLRQKHSQQQKITDHVIKFLLNFLQRQGKSGKRKFPLMIGSEMSENDLTPRSKIAQKSPDPLMIKKSKSQSLIKQVPLKKVLHEKSCNNRKKNVYPDSSEVSFEKLQSAGKNALLPNQLLIDDNDDDRSSDYLDVTTSAKTNSPKFDLLGQSDKDEPSCSSSDLSLNKPLSIQTLQQRLSNDETIKLDCDLIQELFYGTIDITSPRLFDETLSPHSSSQFVTGSEVVRYNSDGNLIKLCEELADEEKNEYSDLSEFCEVINE